MARFAALAATAVLVSSAASAANLPALKFRDQAAEVSAAARLVSAYGIVSSIFRTVAHNRAVGGVPDSYHLLDRAIDIVRRPGITHQQIEAALKRAGYHLVESLDEQNHSHFAFAAVPVQGAASVTTVSSEPPAPPAKPLPRVAADEDGTLAIDLQPQARGASSAAVTRR